MLNEIKKVLLKPYNEQLDEYRVYKVKFDALQEDIIYDACEKDYEAKKKSLKEEYKNSKNKENYEENLQKIMIEYKQKLDDFKTKLEEYNIMKSRLASWNIYELKREMEKINEATNLEALNLTIEQAREICNENGIEFRIDLEQM